MTMKTETTIEPLAIPPLPPAHGSATVIECLGCGKKLNNPTLQERIEFERGHGRQHTQYRKLPNDQAHRQPDKQTLPAKAIKVLHPAFGAALWLGVSVLLNNDRNI